MSCRCKVETIPQPACPHGHAATLTYGPPEAWSRGYPVTIAKAPACCRLCNGSELSRYVAHPAPWQERETPTEADPANPTPTPPPAAKLPRPRRFLCR